MTDEETLALLQQVLPNEVNGTVTITKIKGIGGRGARPASYSINGRAMDGNQKDTIKAWAANNGYTLPDSLFKNVNQTVTVAQDVTKAPWYDDVKNQTDKGMMFLNFAAQAKSVPQLAASLENSQLGSNAQRTTPWGNATALLWEATNRAYDKGYTSFNDLAGGDKSIDLGTTYAGHGATTFSLNFSNGTPYISTGWKDTSEAGDWALPLTLASMFAAPGLAGALGGGVTGAAGAGAILGGSQAAILGGDPIEGALKGGLLGGVSAGAQQLVGPSVSEAVGGGVLGNAAGGAVAGGLQAALTGGDVVQSALKSGLLSGGASLAQGEQTPTLPYNYADDAAQLASQGLSEQQIASVLGSAGAPADMASNIGAYAVNAFNSGLSLADTANYINNNITEDVKFSAADANNLFGQNLSNEQVGQVMDASKMGNTFSSLGQDASFIAADAQQLYKQTNNVGAVQQNLIATGVDPIVAAEVANQVAFGASADEITNSLLDASDPDTLTTENTLFSGDNGLPSANPLSPIKTKVVNGTEQIPTVQAGQGEQSSNVDDSLFLLDRSRYGNLQNPFLRPSSSYRSIVGSIFNG